MPQEWEALSGTSKLVSCARAAGQGEKMQATRHKGSIVNTLTAPRGVLFGLQPARGPSGFCTLGRVACAQNLAGKLWEAVAMNQKMLFLERHC